MILRLTSEQMDLLRFESEKMHPMEACALLFGILNAEEAIVERIVVTPNVLGSSVRFQADPQTVFEVFEEAEQDGMQFIGIFHSHPAPANPSEIDVQYMRLWGEAVWLILSSVDGSIGAFQMVNSDIHRVFLKIEGV